MQAAQKSPLRMNMKATYRSFPPPFFKLNAGVKRMKDYESDELASPCFDTFFSFSSLDISNCVFLFRLLLLMLKSASFFRCDFYTSVKDEKNADVHV